MSDKEVVTLTDLFPEWEADQPQTLVDLLNEDYENLNEKAKRLRKLAVNLVHSFERKPVLTAKAAMHLLEDHHLPARKGKWAAVCLSGTRERVYTKAASGVMRQVSWISTEFPDKATLDKRAPLPEGGTYLLIYGGGPSALNDEKSLAEYSALRKQFHIADVILWEESPDSATFWSVGAGAGLHGNQTMTFPDEKIIERWRNA
jgi:hypothetical protein